MPTTRRVTRSAAKPPRKAEPGREAPIVARAGSVRVNAWLDLDRESSKAAAPSARKGAPRYFVDLRMVGWPAHELVGLTKSRIKALADALAQLHEQLP